MAWQTLRLYARHFLPLFLVGGLPTLLYTLVLQALGHTAVPKMDLQAEEILPPALRTFFLWNLPNLLLLQPLSSGALVAPWASFSGRRGCSRPQALRMALRA